MEQELVVGARVEHELYGVGTIMEIRDMVVRYLVQFDNIHDDLHSAATSSLVFYAQDCMWWCRIEEIKLVTPVLEQPKTESQQLVDILVQLGFVEHYPYKPVGAYNYAYGGKKLDVYWNEHKDVVYHDKHNGGCIDVINNGTIATNIAYFQKRLDKNLKKAAAKPASQSQVEVAIVEKQKVSEPINVEQVTKTKPVKLMKLPQINWTNKIANYNMVMEELRKNEFRQRKNTDLNSSFYYWKYNPDLMVYVDIYFWDIMNDDNETVFSKLTEFGSVDKFRLELAKALKVAPKRFKLKKDFL